MKYTGIVCDRAKQARKPFMTREECNACVQCASHPCPFNGKLLSMLWGDDDHEPNGLTFSPTRLMGCPRAKYLEMHDYPQLLDPYKRWHALRGTMAHSFFEGTAPGPGVVYEIYEQRFEILIPTSYGPQKFAGKPDLIEILHDDGERIVCKVTDWKSKKEVGYDLVEAKESHQKQINMYAYLLHEALPSYLHRPEVQVIVEELEVVYFDMGKVRRFTSKCDLVDRGKMMTPRSSGRYAEMALRRIKQQEMASMRTMIATLIEEAIRARQHLAPIYTGEESRLCPYCPFFQCCGELHREQGV